MCKGTFTVEWSEEEAEEELKNTFGEVDKSECILVCDDCYKKIGL